MYVAILDLDFVFGFLDTYLAVILFVFGFLDTYLEVILFVFWFS